MSLINKMLQDLDARQPAEGDGKVLTQQLRPVRTRKDWEPFWRIMAGLMVIIVGWIVWVLFQITPRPVATELAFESQGKIRPAAPGPQAQAPAPFESKPESAPAAPAPSPAAATTVTAPSVAPAPAAAAAKTPAAAASSALAPEAEKAPPPVQVDMLKLATEIVTPFSEKEFKARPKAEPKPAKAAAPERKPAATAAAQPAAAPAKAARVAPPAPAVAPAPAPPPAQVAALKQETRLPEPKRGPVSIDKQDRFVSPQQRAEAEFRRGTNLLNQGRVAEAVDAYKIALNLDAKHEAARQALVALLLESKHADEAQQVLQDGLAVSPGRSSYAMLLARMLVDRGDLIGAYDLLQRHARGAENHADYHAFSAALLQRLGRNREAVAEYQSALRIAPNAGVWWMGMGISLQADNRNAEALDAFHRAKSAGGLNADLSAFVEQRLRQLQ